MPRRDLPQFAYGIDSSPGEHAIWLACAAAKHVGKRFRFGFAGRSQREAELAAKMVGWARYGRGGYRWCCPACRGGAP